MAKCNYPDCDGGPATGYCHDDCRPPQQWRTCNVCDGSGVRVVRVTVYEHGCGFSHSDSAEELCDKCNGTGGWLDDVEEDGDYQSEMEREHGPDLTRDR